MGAKNGFRFVVILIIFDIVEVHKKCTSFAILTYEISATEYISLKEEMYTVSKIPLQSKHIQFKILLNVHSLIDSSSETYTFSDTPNKHNLVDSLFRADVHNFGITTESIEGGGGSQSVSSYFWKIQPVSNVYVGNEVCLLGNTIQTITSGSPD